MTYDDAERLFYEGLYEQAFSAFKNITLQPQSSLEDKAESLNMMGILVQYVPHLGRAGEESGIEFFKRSIAIWPHSIGSLCNVVETYGTEASNHKDTEILLKAHNILLNEFRDEIPESTFIKIQKQKREIDSNESR